MSEMSAPKNILSEALRELAAASPQGASSELGLSLKDAFARHHSRRRRKRMTVATALVAGVAISMAWLWAGRQPHPNSVDKLQPQTIQPSSAPAVAWHATSESAIAADTSRSRIRARSKPTNKTQGVRHEEPSAVVATAEDFVALPTFDPAIPIGESCMVRLDLPGSALQLIGYPVDEELLERRVLTDVLVGQDGVPYAVRLVQTRSTH